MTVPRQLGHAAPPRPTLTTLEDPLASPHVRALALEIAYRLRPVCGHLSEGDLMKLVTRLALAQQANASPDRPGRP